MDKHTRYRQSEKGELNRKEYQREYMRRYREARKERGDPEPYSKRYHQNLRKRVFERLGGAVCSECGCDEISILEINHKSGGGNKLAKSRSLTHDWCGDANPFGDVVQGKTENEKCP